MSQTASESLLRNVAVNAQFATLAAKKAEAYACGKAIIAGEHAAVYGARAIAIPILSHRLQVQITPQNDLEQTEPIEFYLGTKKIQQHIADVWMEAQELLGLNPRKFSVKAESSLPVGAGLGSSATLCVAALRALSHSFGIAISAERVADLANKLEQRFHGKPSGLDTCVIAHESVVMFQKKQPVQMIDVAGTWRFALIDSGIKASTHKMIKIAEPYFSGSAGEKRIAAFDDLTKRVHSGLSENKFTDVSSAMNEVAILLEESGVVTIELKSIINNCLSLGIPAAKVTGAGGGGAVLALLCPNRYEQQLSSLRFNYGQNHVFDVTLNGGLSC